jgi:tetratricopeptide (TPR) repeat protein
MDDLTYITHNTLVLNGLSSHSIRAAFSIDNAIAPMYMPLLWVSYMVDVSLLNASPAHPWGFHFTNVLLHAVNVGLLFFLLATWCKKPWRAFFFAALWAFHPLRVESVAWVAERKDVLSGFFCLLCVGCYAWANREKIGPRPFPYMLSFASYLCALLVKPSVVPLPVILLLLDIWPLRRLEFTLASARRLPVRLLEKAPFFIAAIAIAIAAIHGHQAVGALAHSSLVRRGLQVPIHYGFYLIKLFAPVHLGPLYPLVAFSWTRFIAASVLLILPSFWAWNLRIRRPQAAVGWLWFLVFLAPVVGFFGTVGAHSAADRFTYLPAMGLSIALLSLWPSPIGRERRKGNSIVRAVVAGCFLALLSLLTLRLLPTWRDSDHLFARVSLIAPDHPAILNVRILRQLHRDGDFQAAQTALEQALRINPHDIEIIGSLALCIHERQGAVAALDFLVSHRPTGIALGEWEFQEAVYFFLGADYEQARDHVNQARQLISPNDAGQNNLLLLGMAAAFEMGDSNNALAYAQLLPPYRNRAEIDLSDLFPLHVFHWDMGLRRDALAYFRRLVQTYPARGDLLNNVAWILATAEWSPAPPKEAVEIARQVQTLASDPQPILLDTLAVAHANAGDFETAIQTTRQALALIPDNPSNDVFRRNLQSRIELYRKHEPYREEATTRHPW